MVTDTNIGDSILHYVNSGVTLDGLAQALDKAGVANKPTAVLSDDMTGDGKNEVVVSIFDPLSKSIPPAGRLLILVCQGSKFMLEYNQTTPDNFGGPHLWYLKDLDADGKAELVDSLARCGAHTCFERVRVIVWEDGSFHNRMDGDTMELPFPIVKVSDTDGDQVFDIEVSGTGIGSVGAGPPRGETWVYAYDRDGGIWRRTEVILAESDYRIHIIHDADELARAGEYQKALIAYQKVLDDASLKDWIDPESEKANLQAYARFKMLVIFSILEQEQFAETTFLDMVELYPVEFPQHKFVQLAEEFMRANRQGNLSDGCEAARTYASEHPEDILSPLNSYGYGNPEVTPGDICPFQADSEVGG